MANILSPEEKQARLAVLKRLAENNAAPKPPNPGRPERLLRKQEVREIDKPMKFTPLKLKAFY